MPVVIWEVDKTNEKALDRYEGYPTFYYKKDIKVQYKGIRTGNRRTVTAFALHYARGKADRCAKPFLPINTCLDGYDTFYFDKQILLNAYHKSAGSCTKMTDNLVQLRTCPRCGGVYSGHGAVSRADNLTVICRGC